ncbi:thiolase domain-containing protein [Alphaproteobacteria bacterium GH1-50]|uniref:Thiolase domain-containing protein n=1 Tax=Kangsaoukella pontilimi TaxID=2691042 RepID=A0A7C9MZA8_9RHOB|nr:thiolase domain-containing protein [Kangsaoukella pontilimi]MXQ07338.1 thiolase domain-containing protein [Kangsaoukella pontilimi]
MRHPALIVGCGHSKFGRLEEHSLEDLIQAVSREAIEDAGLAPSEIDAVFLGHFNSGMVADGFCSSMALAIHPDLRFKPAVRLENACASGSAAIFGALDAIAAGRIKTALVVGAEKMTHLSTAEVTDALAGASYQKEEAGVSFPEIFARFARAYRAEYTDPSRAMAEIAVKNHHNALDNPLAQMQRELSLDFCLEPSNKNPMIAEPLRVTDCSLISDGAAAIVLAHEDRAGDFERAVAFRAATQVNDLLPLSAKPQSRMEGPARAFRAAYESAGLALSDISFAEVHDCFTIAELMIVEAMGLAAPGEGPRVVGDGITAQDGRLPINRSGGLKAKGHPVGATGVSMHVLAARQLTGRAGAMQLPRSDVGMCFNMGGGAVASYVSILEPVHA